MNKKNLLFFKDIEDGEHFCRKHCNKQHYHLPYEQDYLVWAKSAAIETNNHVQGYAFCVGYILYVAEMLRSPYTEEIADRIRDNNFPCTSVTYYFDKLKLLLRLCKKDMEIE